MTCTGWVFFNVVLTKVGDVSKKSWLDKKL